MCIAGNANVIPTEYGDGIDDGGTCMVKTVLLVLVLGIPILLILLLNSLVFAKTLSVSAAKTKN